jgi:chorismate--pyruvate lyase
MAASVDMPTAASAEHALWPAAVPAAALWLPPNALNCYVGDAALRSWLLTPGLLTQRIREAAGDGFAMRLLHEGAAGPDHAREIDMGSDGAVWMYAHTRIPRRTLEAAPWLAVIGTRTLGEALAGRQDLERDEFRFAQLYPDAWLAARVLRHAQLSPQPLWVRHSPLRVGGAPFDLYEVFLPSIGRRGGR